MMDINRVLLQWFINFLTKKLLAAVLKMKILLAMNQRKNYINQLLENLKKRKVQSPFIDNIWGTDLADMQLISKFNNGLRILLCVIDIYRKYARVIPLKDQKDITIANAFQEILKESNRKPNKIWLHKGSEFYSSSMKSWLE